MKRVAQTFLRCGSILVQQQQSAYALQVGEYEDREYIQTQPSLYLDTSSVSDPLRPSLPFLLFLDSLRQTVMIYSIFIVSLQKIMQTCNLISPLSTMKEPMKSFPDILQIIRHLQSSLSLTLLNNRMMDGSL